MSSEPVKISPRLTIYIFFINNRNCLRRFSCNALLGNKITHFDSLVDFVSKEKIIGELPFKKKQDKEGMYSRISEELSIKQLMKLLIIKKILNLFNN